MKKIFSLKIFWFVILLVVSNKVLSQNALPDFSINNMGKNKIIISWENTYTNVVQISVQRSYDSLKNFQTVFSSQSPQLPRNGFADNNVSTSVRYYYRIFFVLNDGRYYFSPAKASNRIAENIPVNKWHENNRIILEKNDTGLMKPNPTNTLQPEKFFYIYNRYKDSLLFVLDTVCFNRFKDSIILQTKDTLWFSGNRDVLLKPYVSLIWRPSVFLFTDRRGSLKINLPLVKKHKYRIKIFDTNGSQLFELKNITDDVLYLEKGNFFHAGWFGFELYEDDKLKERNKFYLGKVF